MGGSRCIAPPIINLGTKVGVQLHAPTALTPGKEPLIGDWLDPQSLFGGRGNEISQGESNNPGAGHTVFIFIKVY